MQLPSNGDASRFIADLVRAERRRRAASRSLPIRLRGSSPLDHPRLRNFVILDRPIQGGIEVGSRRRGSRDPESLFE